MITATHAYNLYRRFALQFQTYTSDEPEGRLRIPEVEEGHSEYIFNSSSSLAEFLTFVEKNK